jgi:hypothetical protein
VLLRAARQALVQTVERPVDLPKQLARAHAAIVPSRNGRESALL